MSPTSPLAPWQTAWRDVIAPRLTTRQVEIIRHAIVTSGQIHITDPVLMTWLGSASNRELLAEVHETLRERKKSHSSIDDSPVKGVIT